MSAREELEHYLTFSGLGPERRKTLVDAALREHAHALAEKIRGEAESAESYEWFGGMDRAADLIESEVGA